MTRSPLALYALAMFVWYVATLIPEAVDLSHVSTFIVMILLAHFALRTAAQRRRRAGPGAAPDGAGLGGGVLSGPANGAGFAPADGC